MCLLFVDFLSLRNSMENQEKEDKPKEEETKEPVVEEKPRTRSTQPKEAAPAFMSSVFAFMDVYLNKMLVRPHKQDNKTQTPSLPEVRYQISLKFVCSLLPELPGSQLLQHALPGPLCVLCHQLHSSLLQGNTLHITHIHTYRSVCMYMNLCTAVMKEASRHFKCCLLDSV